MKVRNNTMNTQEIIDEIDKYLDKALLKTSKITNAELIEFIEAKWAQADDEKYNIYASQIICGRMINEYAALKDVKNVRRWLEMYGQHENSQQHPEYIFMRGKGCIDLFCKHTGIKSPKEKVKVKKKYFEGYVNLPVWEKFFGEEAKEILYNVGGDEPKYRLSRNHKSGLKYVIDNQEAILSALLNELNNQYADLQSEYDYDDEERVDFMPDVTKISDFADLISPMSIHILSVHKDGMPYVGWLKACDSLNLSN